LRSAALARTHTLARTHARTHVSTFPGGVNRRTLGHPRVRASARGGADRFTVNAPMRLRANRQPISLVPAAADRRLARFDSGVVHSVTVALAPSQQFVTTMRRRCHIYCVGSFRRRRPAMKRPPVGLAPISIARVARLVGVRTPSVAADDKATLCGRSEAGTCVGTYRMVPAQILSASKNLSLVVAPPFVEKICCWKQR
jgi:hypothetical protein